MPAYNPEEAKRHLRSVVGYRAAGVVLDALGLLAESHAARAYAALAEDWPVRAGGARTTLHPWMRARAQGAGLAATDVLRLATLRVGQSLEIGRAPTLETIERLG